MPIVTVRPATAPRRITSGFYCAFMRRLEAIHLIEVSITQEPFIIFGINVGLSVVVAWCVIAALILLMLVFGRRVTRYSDKPRGVQLVFETLVTTLMNYTKSQAGHHAAFAVPAILTLMTYVLFTTIVEMLGFPPSTEDINCTIALGLCAFITVNATVIHAKGVKGRLQALTKPTPVVAPIKFLTDCITPFSMAIRLFANVLAGGVIMQLIYRICPVVLPAALGAYFNVLHVLIQMLVFGLLPVIYISESLE